MFIFFSGDVLLKALENAVYIYIYIDTYIWIVRRIMKIIVMRQ